MECGAIMIKRFPKPGRYFDPFYGCRNWPECKYTRGIFPDGRIMDEMYYLDDLRWIYEEN